MDGHVFLHVLVSPGRDHCESAGARTHFCHETYWYLSSIIFLLEIGIQSPLCRSSPSWLGSFWTRISTRPARVLKTLSTYWVFGQCTTSVQRRREKCCL